MKRLTSGSAACFRLRKDAARGGPGDAALTGFSRRQRAALALVASTVHVPAAVPVSGRRLALLAAAAPMVPLGAPGSHAVAAHWARIDSHRAF